MTINLRVVSDEDLKVLNEAREIAFRSAQLEKALKRWHNKAKKNCPETERDFNKWLLENLEYCAHNLGAYADAQNIVWALRIAAIGDADALYLARKAKKDGWTADTNCYVEEGIVYLSVWISGKSAQENKERAEEVAAYLRNVGYVGDSGEDVIEDDGYVAMVSMPFANWLANLERNQK